MDKEMYIKSWAENDWDGGQVMGQDEFREFQKIAEEDGYSVEQEDFDYYFECVNDARAGKEIDVTYQVWVLGYTEEDIITDLNEFFGEFLSSLEATKYAKSLSLSDMKDKLEKMGAEIPEDVRYLHLQVETIKQCKNWEENVDTIYEDTFDLKEEE